NGKVVLAAGSRVRGQIVAGPEAPVELEGDARVSGATFARPAPVTLAPVAVPDVVRQRALVHAGPLPRIVPPGAAAFDALEVRADAQLVLVGPLTLVSGALALGPGAELVLDARSGPIELTIDGPLTLDP